MQYLNLTRITGVLCLVASTIGLAAGNAQAISFAPRPGQGAPSQATGGASRGNIKFAPRPGQGAPSQSTGGASRGNLFRAPKGKGAPQQATGGASRGQLFKPAQRQGAPSRSAGGASRIGRYDLTQLSSQNLSAATGPAALVAMLPSTYSGTTIAARPTLMAYLPASSANTATFSLKDAAGNLLYQQQIAVSGEAGVMPIALPAAAPALELNQQYQWYVALHVDGELNPSTPYVDGWIQRVAPSDALQTALQQPDRLKQAEALGAEGLWYDCAATMAALRAEQPDNPALVAQWTELLTSVGLQEVSQVPVIATIAQ
jgi:Domain of Unknown Function (DUF928)